MKAEMELLKGGTYHNEDETMFTASITTLEHGNMIECHGSTVEEAELIRDTVLILLSKN